jgi:hypothetical protein
MALLGPESVSKYRCLGRSPQQRVCEGRRIEHDRRSGSASLGVEILDQWIAGRFSSGEARTRSICSIASCFVGRPAKATSCSLT